MMRTAIIGCMVLLSSVFTVSQWGGGGGWGGGMGGVMPGMQFSYQEPSAFTYAPPSMKYENDLWTYTPPKYDVDKTKLITTDSQTSWGMGGWNGYGMGGMPTMIGMNGWGGQGLGQGGYGGLSTPMGGGIGWNGYGMGGMSGMIGMNGRGASGYGGFGGGGGGYGRARGIGGYGRGIGGYGSGYGRRY